MREVDRGSSSGVVVVMVVVVAKTQGMRPEERQQYKSGEIQNRL